MSGNSMFASRPPEKAFNVVPWAIAGVVVLLVILALAAIGRGKPAAAAKMVLPPDPYSASMVFSGIEMSESTSLSGGKSTYIDGRVKNAGDRTLTGATVQVLFANSEAMPPQIVTTPLTLVRTHEPYVDTQPIADAPMAPGDEREFRLVFEGITANWNQQLPDIHVVRVATR